MPDLAIRLRAETAEFESDMGRARHVAEREMEGMIGRAVALGTMVGDAISKAAGHFARLTAETLKAGDELSKLSQRSGLSVERLSELQFAAQLSDVSLSSLGTTMGFFNKALADAQNENTKTGQTFRALGVDIEAGPQKAMDQFLKAVGGLENHETKVAALRVAFGRTGDALLPMIANLDETTERARRLGVVFGEDLAKQSERFNDALKALQLSSQALAIQALQPTVGGLTMIAENMLAAKERSTTLRDGVIELAKVFIAAHAQIASVVPYWGQYIEDSAQRAFMALDRLRGAFPAQFLAGDFQAVPKGMRGALADAPASSEMVACAVAGGKWDATSNTCVYKKTPSGGRAPRDNTAQLMRDQLALGRRMTDADNKAMQDYAEQMAKMMDGGAAEDMAQQLELNRRLTIADAKAMEDYAAQIDKMNSAAEKATKSTEKTSDVARDLGLSFVSAFEDAVVHGKKLSDVLKGLEQDILRIITRKLVTEPLGGVMSDWLKGVTGGGPSGSLSGLLSGLFGGGTYEGVAAEAAGSFVGSFASGTPFVPRTGFAMIHQGERILTRDENRAFSRTSMPAITINLPPGMQMGQQSLRQVRAAAYEGTIEAARRLGRAR